MSKSLWILIIVAIFFGGIFWTLSETQIKTDMPYYLKKLNRETTVVKIDGLEVEAEVANTPEAREKGLSGRVGLGDKRGMLFVFDNAGIYSFTAKGMVFPFDIIWIKDDKIVDMTKNIPIPQIGEELKTYEPRFEANYVLETQAHFCDQHDLKIGMPVVLDSEKVKKSKIY